MSNLKLCKTSMKFEIDLHSPEDIHLENANRKTCGSMIYLSGRTRLVILLAVRNFAIFASKPGTIHRKLTKRVLQCRCRTLNFCFIYQPSSLVNIYGVFDSDWAGDIPDRKTLSGLFFMMCGSSVSCRLFQQKVVTFLSAKVEYVSF